MINEPLVSVIVPIYNSEQFIEMSINSICQQMYKNLEIILVDDGSTDNSICIAEQLLLRYERYYKIIRQANSGLPSARNRGIEESSGKYICFIDSDDIISKEHISQLVELIHKEHVSVAFSDFEKVSEKNRLGTNNYKFSAITYSKNELINFFVLRKPAIHCCSLLILNSFLKNNSVKFNENLKYGEDAEFMWRLFSIVKKSTYSRCKTYKYLIRDNSIMSSVGIKKGEIFQFEFKKTITNLISKDPQNKKIYNWAYYRNLLGWLHSIASNSNYRIFKKGLSKELRKDIYKNLIDFPDSKIRVLSFVIRFFPYCFYKLFGR